MLLAIGLPVPNATQVEGVEGAIQHLTQSEVSLAFTTPELLAGVLKSIRENQLSTPVVAVGPASQAAGARSIRLGAVEYLTTPLESRQLKALTAKYAQSPSTGGPIAADAATKTLMEQAKQFANSSATVLLRGESGTGIGMIRGCSTWRRTRMN